MSAPSVAQQAKEILGQLKRRGSKKNVEGMARYGIVAKKVMGVSIGDLRTISKGYGRNHELAKALWKSGVYEARMLVAFVGDPEQLTPAQMDAWCRDFDNWAICDALCFHLYDKTPHAYKKVAEWARSDEEFVKRAAFALAASLAGHDKKAADKPFEQILPIIERGATDGRNFVKKGVSWALRGIGMRSPNLHARSLALARKLAESSNPAARWVGKDTIRDITRPLVLKRVAKRRT